MIKITTSGGYFSLYSLFNIDRYIYHFINNYAINLHMCEFCSTFVAERRRRRNGVESVLGGSKGRNTENQYNKLNS